MTRKPAILLIGWLLAAALVLGIVHLFDLQFDRGDLYPPYSTMRADPLGASVFYESLGRMPGVTARRYFEKNFTEDDGRGRTLFILGLPSYGFSYLPREEFEHIQQFVFRGGHVVVAYFPQVAKNWSTRQHEKELQNDHGKNGKKTGDKGPVKEGNPNDPNVNPPDEPDKSGGDQKDGKKMSRDKDEEGDFSGPSRWVSLGEAWGFQFDYHNLPTNDEGAIEFPVARLSTNAASLPETLPVHTALFFSELTNGWTTIYQRDDMPVVVEKKSGKGSVMLVADSYCFSNEALFKERDLRLLAWLTGGAREAVFDEAHLGVVVDPGIAALMRKYRLHGLIFSLVLVAGLFVWKNSLSLVPPVEETSAAGGAPVLGGKDSMSGFVNLLRRGIPRPNVMNVCYEEWQKSAGRRAAISGAQRREVEQIIARENALPPRERNPVQTYRAIGEVLHRKK